MWPEGLVLENINNSDLGRITHRPFWALQFQSLVVTGVQDLGAQSGQSQAVLCQHGWGESREKARTDLCWLQDTNTERSCT